MKYQNEEEYEWLCEIYKGIPRKRYVLEIGSLTGDSLWGWITQAKGENLQIISIDMIVPPPDPRRIYQLAGHDLYWPRLAESFGNKLACFDADSTARDTVTRVKSLVPYLDFLFIDGGHDYQTVKADYENYGPLVRSGGVIAFHDISGGEWPEIKRFWEELCRAKAANRMESRTLDANFGIGVLWRD